MREPNWEYRIHGYWCTHGIDETAHIEIAEDGVFYWWITQAWSSSPVADSSANTLKDAKYMALLTLWTREVGHGLRKKIPTIGTRQRKRNTLKFPGPRNAG